MAEVLRIERFWDGTDAPSELAAVVQVEVGGPVRVTVDAPYLGGPAPDQEVGSLWGLWEYEVVELFVTGASGYLELEMGPHGHWLFLRLGSVREVLDKALPVEFVAKIRGERWVAEATFSKSLLPREPRAVNAYAIYGVGATRQYLAAEPVFGDEPDFHRLECFRKVSL